MSKLQRLFVPLMVALTIFLITVPVLAACYAYIYVEESDGNSYEELPLICSCNITSLVESGFISSTGLNTRVITGDGATLPHMLADDKILFVSDLAAYEDKTLIFYLGASSLSSFPIIVGYNGTFETPDDDDLELGYVMELLISGYFDASGGSDQNILYKEDAFRVWIPEEETLKVAAYNSTGDEQWNLEYDEFDSGTHIVYIVANGLAAYLYVDDFEVAKDTENLFESSNAVVNNVIHPSLNPRHRCTFYANNLYWAFFWKAASENIFYRTSVDGLSWSSEYTISTVSSDDLKGGLCVWLSGSYMHIVYYSLWTDNDYYIRYRRGVPEADSSITWSAGWQTAVTATGTAELYDSVVAADTDEYPFIIYRMWSGNYYTYVTKSATNDGTWSTEGGYPIMLYATPQDPQQQTITAYPNSDKIYALWEEEHGSGHNPRQLYGKYYNGDSWVGSPEVIDNTFPGDSQLTDSFNAVADDDDNLYIVWTRQDIIHSWYSVELKIRYADGTFSPPIEVYFGTLAAGDPAPSVSYNDDNGYIYITYVGEDNFIRCRALANNTLSGEYPLPFNVGTSDEGAATPYGSHIGLLYNVGTSLQHGYISFPWDWNDNDSDWLWMQNNVMPYADYFQMYIDGELQLEYKPDSIIQGTTLPDEENDHDGTITWGSNPVDVSHSELMCEEEEGAGYYYFDPGAQDIIKPEPETMTGDVDLERLRANPLYPLVQILSIDGFLNERLVWLGLAWFIVIIAMLGVHLGFDTRPDTEKPQHFILTTITGLGLSILFYTMGIFPLLVIILMAFSLGGAIVWERQPVI